LYSFIENVSRDLDSDKDLLLDLEFIGLLLFLLVKEFDLFLYKYKPGSKSFPSSDFIRRFNKKESGFIGWILTNAILVTPAPLLYPEFSTDLLAAVFLSIKSFCFV